MNAPFSAPPRGLAWRFGLVLGLAAALWGGSASAGDLQVTVVDKEGKPVIDAVVLLQVNGSAVPASPMSKHAVISQERMRFLPPVSLVAVGAKVRFVNNDPWEHHVRGSAAGILQFNAAAGEGFEMRLDGRVEGKLSSGVEVPMDKAGPVLLGCHIHASMRGFVYVSDTPWAAVTDAQGLASFEAVPNGPTQVKVWHGDQLLDIAPQKLVLTAAPAQVSMQLTVVPRKRRV
jgi:plastocyanin